MALGTLWERIKQRSLTTILIALVAPLMLTPVTQVTAYAADTPNFKVHIENSLSATPNSLYIYNTYTKTKDSLSFDSSGNINKFLADGEYTAVLFPNKDESDSRTSSNYKFTINSGTLTSIVRVKNYLNEKPIEEVVATNGSGYYVLYLGTTGFKLDMSIGIDTKTVSISEIYAVNKYSKPINPTYLSDGKVVVDIDPGTYTVFGTDANGTDSGSTTCTVTTGTISTCSIALVAPNFPYRIVSSTGETLTSTSEIQLNFQKLDEKDGIEKSWWVRSSDTGSQSLQNGRYDLKIYKNYLDAKTGQSSNYRLTVVSESVSEVKSVDSGETFTVIGGKYPLKLRSENFKFKVTADGTVFKNFYMYSWNNSKGTNAWAYPDSAGNVSTSLKEGLNYVYIEIIGSSTNYVRVSGRVTVTNGIVSEFLLNSGSSLSSTDGIYTVPILVANVQGTLTIGGEVTSGWFAGVFDLNLKKFVNVNGVGINSEGKFGLYLPAGSYRIGLQPGYSGHSNNILYKDCNVPSSGTVTCNLSAPARNFTFEVFNVSDTLVANNASSSVRFINPEFVQDAWIGDASNGRYTLSLQDGKNLFTVRSSTPNSDGQERRYAVYIANGTVTRVVDEKLDLNVSPVGSVYRLKLGTPNFKGVVKANGAVNPRAYVYAYQEGFETLQSNADSDGRIGFDLPNGRNTVVINTTGNETPTVVSARFTVIVESSTVTSVSNMSEETLTATTGVYTLDYQIPNIVGTLTVDDRATSGYIQGVWNTVQNKSTNFGGSSIDSNGNYAILVPAGNHDVLFVPNGGVGGVQNCNATAGVRTTCNINFPATNFSIKIKNSSGTVLTSRVNAYVTRQFGKGQSFPGQSYGYSLTNGAEGLFSGSLVDGDYQLNILSNSPFTDGDSRQFSFKVESGTAGSLKDLLTLDLVDSVTALAGISLVAPNLKVIVNANSSPAVNVYGNIYSVNAKGSYYKYFRVDSEGKISFKLPDGDFKLDLWPSGNESPLVVRASLDISVRSGEVTSAKYRDGTSATSSAGIYTFNLGTPNLTGTYTYGGESAAGSEIYFSNVYDENTLRFVDFDFASNNAGSYGMRISEGTYLLSLYKYGKSGTLQRCVVSGTASTCNFDVPLDNFSFKIQSSLGEDLPIDVGANSRITLDTNEKYGGWNFWMRPGVGGIFKSGLKVPSGLSANYEFTIFPTDGSNRRGIARTYRVSVSGESITAVTDVLTGSSVTPGADGVYAFRLTSANLAGTVVAPDGSTPIPNASVQAQGPQYLGFGTDNSGAFAGYLEKDGSYSVWAIAPEFDITKADSARTTVEVVGGSGNSSLTLTLRTPNVQGVVSGPIGISAYNYIEVLKKNEYGNFEYYGYNVRPRSSNTQGKFAFYLEPGIYKFQAQADQENAGGGRTISGECSVTDTSTVKNCDITLISSNVKLKILGEGDQIFTQGYVNIWYEGSKYSSSWPEKTWDNSSISPQGLARLAATNGTWRGRVDIYGSGNESPLDFTVVIETGTVTSITSSEGETFTANTDGFFEVKLPISNLRGSILDAGSKFTGGSSISVWQTDAEEGYSTSRWSNSGDFAFRVKPGIYSIEVYPYSWGKESLNTPVRTRIVNCEVPKTGIKTCDVSLKTPNFKARITTPGGQIASESYAYIHKSTTSEDGNKFYGWYEHARVQGGLFASFLETGTYRVTVDPGWEARGSYTANNFEVIVSAGAIQSVKNLSTNAVIAATNGIYSLNLATPAITGKVLKSGTSTVVVKWAQVLVLDTTTGDELWEYSTNTNSSGNFSLNVPDGTYDVMARIWGGKGDGDSGFTSSSKYRVSVSGGTSDSLTIRMKDPNFKLRVVSPTSATTGLTNVWIHGNFNGQYFGGMTDKDGYFSAYIDTSTTTSCSGTCRINIYPATQNSYIPNSVNFTNVSDIGNVSPGVVNSTVYVYIPTNGGTGIPNKWSWISVEELNETGTVVSEFGYGTNELGQTGIGLTEGKKYRITAYPSGEFYGRYSPKSVTIPSFTLSANAIVSITFDSPNITFIVKDSSEVPNSWAWYEIFTMESITATKYVDGYLNEQGRGAQYLPDGDYKVIFYPGGSKGVEKTITFTVSGSHATNGSGVTFTNDVGTIVLGSGNVTGTIKNSGGTALANAAVTATSTSGAATKVSTVTKSDGTYELNLSTSQAWSIQAIDPITLKTGSIAIAQNAATYTGKDISLAP